MPGAWPCAFPSGTPRTRCMKCVTLPDTCVEILPIPFVDAVVAGEYAPMNGTHLERRRRRAAAPIRLHVGGLDAVLIVAEPEHWEPELPVACAAASGGDAGVD